MATVRFNLCFIYGKPISDQSCKIKTKSLGKKGKLFQNVISTIQMADKSFTKIVCFSSLEDSYPPEKIKSIREKSERF
jgi:hypothetical protein